jgi:hypothetical protein
MKTFQEALDTIVPNCRADAPPERHRELECIALNQAHRARGLLAEAEHHAVLTEILATAYDASCCQYHEKNALAVRDGFRGIDGDEQYALAQMMGFWKGRTPFVGNVIHWKFSLEGLA